MNKYNFIKNNITLNTSQYPLLKDYSEAKNKPIITSHFFSCEDLDEVICEEVFQFLNHHSIKDALRESLKISSPIVTKFINDKIFKENEKNIEFCLTYYLIADTLASIFLRQDKPNTDAFIKFLDKRPTLGMLAPLFNKKLQLQKFLNDNFSEEKKVDVLNNSNRKDEVGDLLAMYMQDDVFFKTHLASLSFHEKSSLGYCHDIIAKQLSKLQTVNFELKQETHWPILKELDGKNIYKDFYFVVPKSHHDLITWGNILGHCIGSRHYAEAAYKGHGLLLGVADKNRLKFTMEIKAKHIAQIQGLSRSSPERELQNEIDKALFKADLIRN